jgi:hypothetical protein
MPHGACAKSSLTDAAERCAALAPACPDRGHATAGCPEALAQAQARRSRAHSCACRPARLLLLGVACLCRARAAAAAFACAAANNSTQCGALADLFTATGGAGWANTSGWADAAAGRPTDFCTFAGVSCSWTLLGTACAFVTSGTHNASAVRAATVACALQLRPGLTYAFTTCGSRSDGAPLLRLLAGTSGGSEVANSMDAPASAAGAPCSDPPGVGLAFGVPAAVTPNASALTTWALLAGCVGDGACSGNVSGWVYDPGRALPQTAPATVLRLCAPDARIVQLLRRTCSVDCCCDRRRDDACRLRPSPPTQRLVVPAAERLASGLAGRVGYACGTGSARKRAGGLNARVSGQSCGL